MPGLENPGRIKPQAESQNLGTVYVEPPLHVEVISWHSSGDRIPHPATKSLKKGLRAG